MSGEDILDLGGQVALVTGAGQGAGRGIALMLARHGAGGVAVNDFVLERAEAVAEEIRALGVKAAAVQADVSDLDSVRAMAAKATAELGPVTRGDALRLDDARRELAEDHRLGELLRADDEGSVPGAGDERDEREERDEARHPRSASRGPR